MTSVLGHPFSAGNGVSINLPDIYIGESKIILVELVISPREEGSHKLLDLVLEYADMKENLALVNLQASLETKFTNYPGEGPAENIEVLKHVELFRYLIQRPLQLFPR